MARARQPVSGRQLVGVLAGVAVAVVAKLGAGAVSTAGWIVALGALTFVVQPLATLGHELGHALAVAVVAQRPSLVVVGRGPFLRIRADPTLVLLSPMPTRGVPFSGICRYDPSGLSWRAIAMIALAGPLATLCELGALAAVASTLWSTEPVMRLLILLTAACLITSLTVNLWPSRATIAPGQQSSIRRDGVVARLAYSRHRAGAPPLTSKS